MHGHVHGRMHGYMPGHVYRYRFEQGWVGCACSHMVGLTRCSALLLHPCEKHSRGHICLPPHVTAMQTVCWRLHHQAFAGVLADL